MMRVKVSELDPLPEQLEELVGPGRTGQPQECGKESEDDEGPCHAADALGGVLRRRGAGLAAKGQEDLPPGVESGQERGQGKQQPTGEIQASAHAGSAARGELEPGLGQDLVLAPEPGKGKDAGQSQGAGDKGPTGAGHAPQQAAHVHHVVGVELPIVVSMGPVVRVMVPMLHPMDHRAGAHEQKCLEKGVHDEMEHGGYVGAHPQGGKHVAKLADGGVG